MKSSELSRDNSKGNRVSPRVSVVEWVPMGVKLMVSLRDEKSELLSTLQDFTPHGNGNLPVQNRPSVAAGTLHKPESKPSDVRQGAKSQTKPANKTQESQTDETAELNKLAAWFQDNRDTLPQSPFTLRPGEKVSNPKGYYAAIERDIRAGFGGPRAKNGALQIDLLQLRNLSKLSNLI